MSGLRSIAECMPGYPLARRLLLRALGTLVLLVMAVTTVVLAPLAMLGMTAARVLKSWWGWPHVD